MYSILPLLLLAGVASAAPQRRPSLPPRRPGTFALNRPRPLPPSRPGSLPPSRPGTFALNRPRPLPPSRPGSLPPSRPGTFALNRPRPLPPSRPGSLLEVHREFVPILSQGFNGPFGPVYDFNYEGGDGTRREESGRAAFSDGTGPSVSQGSWRFTFPDGSPAQFDFVADLNGYRASSDLLPALPQHAKDQIAHAEWERSQGIVHDGQWDEARWGARNYGRK